MSAGPASRPRHGRQVRLVEVGEAGQARIGRARASVATEGLAAWVETRYLAGAGVGVLTVPRAELARAARAVDANVVVEVAALPIAASPIASPASDPALEDLGLRDPACRAVATGALAALAVLRGAIREASS